ncbi:MAG: GNAT family N-acetyltransferase [Polyangiaceae bacterium]
MSEPLPVRVEWLAPEHMDGFVALFEADGSPCYCRYWHFEGDKNAWLLRCAETPEVNPEEARRDVAAGEARARGLVAIDEAGAIVGWMKLAPRATLPKLRRLPTYRAHDLGDDDGILSIGCFLVRPDVRERGVARALVVGALRLAKDAGARAVEAYPRDGIHAAEAWTGPSAIFDGFAHVAGEAPYRVLRATL